MEILLGAIKIIIVLGTLISIHELGHFLVAKACKVKVHKFAIGFGPKLFTKQGKETEYTLRLIPFGGFVQLEGEEERSEDERAFNKKPIYQRILIIAAGATVNIVFALIIYCILATSNNYYVDNSLALVPEGTYEYASGLRVGDKILKVNNKNILVGYDVTDMIEKSKKDEFDFLVDRNGSKEEIKVNIPIHEKGLAGIYYDTERRIVSTTEGSSAASSGLMSGDVITQINGITIDSWEQVVPIVSQLPNQKINMIVERDGELVSIDLMTSGVEGRHYYIKFNAVEPHGFDRIRYALNETGDYFKANIEGIISLFSGKSENVQVMGVVGVANEITKSESIKDFFYLMSAISLSLGIFNLMPIPALDGGKILILIIEKIRRKPMNEKTEGIITLIGFGLIIALALVVTVFDVIGLF